MDCSDNSNTQEESVQEKRMKWKLNEDKAMAEQLQLNEFRDHYIHNKQKNAQLREDISSAKTLAKEIEKMTMLQIKMDREIAKKLRDQERAGKRKELDKDFMLAVKLQAKELKKLKENS